MDQRKSHMECYNFYQKCKNYFAIAGARRANQIPFATSFLQDQINFYWKQYKRKHDANSSALVI